MPEMLRSDGTASRHRQATPNEPVDRASQLGETVVVRLPAHVTDVYLLQDDRKAEDGEDHVTFEKDRKFNRTSQHTSPHITSRIRNDENGPIPDIGYQRFR